MNLNQKAFTLIEVMIALTILASLSVFTANALRSSAQDKVKIQSEIDRKSKFRSAINIIERDIKTTFNYRDINIEIYKKISEADQLEQTTKKKGLSTGKEMSTGKELSTGGTTTPTQKTEEPKDTGPLIDIEKYDNKRSQTYFLGEKDKINFNNLNHVRTSEKAQESMQQEVGYFIKNCRNRVDPKLSYPCLWRRTDPYIDEDVEEGGKAIVLLENVKKFELKYYNKKDDEWVASWDNSEKGRDFMKYKVPELIEVSISFEDQGKIEEARYTFPVSFPNNEAFFSESSKTTNKNNSEEEGGN